NENHATMLLHVGGIDPAAIAWDLIAHIAILRADSANRRIRQAISIGHREPLHGFQAGSFYQSSFLLHFVQVRLLKTDLLPGTLSTSLFTGLSRPADH